MISKVIHYVWLSGERMPPLNRKCVRSWKKVLPDYELRRWTRGDFDIDSMPYVKEAIEAGKWAFATDYLRLYILLREGGIYLDTDVYMLGNFDEYLHDCFFSCIEYHHDSTHAKIQAACMGAEPGHPFVRACLDYYENRHFLNRDGSFDTKLLAPDVYAMTARKFGFSDLFPTGQELSEGIRIYDSTLIAGTPWEIAEGNRGVHMCAGSWRDMSRQYRLKINRVKSKLLRRGTH